MSKRAKKQAVLGRPPLPKRAAKRATVSIRLTTDERSRLDDAAKQADMNPSEWGRTKIVKALPKLKKPKK